MKIESELISNFLITHLKKFTSLSSLRLSKLSFGTESNRIFFDLYAFLLNNKNADFKIIDN